MEKRPPEEVVAAEPTTETSNAAETSTATAAADQPSNTAEPSVAAQPSTTTEESTPAEGFHSAQHWVQVTEVSKSLELWIDLKY